MSVHRYASATPRQSKVPDLPLLLGEETARRTGSGVGVVKDDLDIVPTRPLTKASARRDPRM